MGGKSSKTPKPELNRSKSFSSFGRSSQRFLFQKSRAKLDRINKELRKHEDKGGSALEEIKKQLESVETDLNDISPAIKEKNKQKYEEVLKRLKETREKVEAKTPPVEDNSNTPAVPEAPPENVPQHVELTVVKVAPTEDPDIILRKPLVRENIEEALEQPRSPKVKFGVQVMPIDPRVSQELLKRKTLPINEAPKAEFLNIRRRAESDGNQEIVQNDLYNHHLLNHREEEARPSTLIKNNELYEFPPQENVGKHPDFGRTLSTEEKPLKVLEKRQVNVNALEEIESIAKDISKLENKLKYFRGKQGDVDYVELHERFVLSLLMLDNVAAQGDPVVRQEKKIAIHRIQELIRILERLVNQTEEVDEPNFPEDTAYDFVEIRQEEVVNAEGKPVTATAL